MAIACEKDAPMSNPRSNMLDGAELLKCEAAVAVRLGCMEVRELHLPLPWNDMRVSKAPRGGKVFHASYEGGVNMLGGGKDKSGMC